MGFEFDLVDDESLLMKVGGLCFLVRKSVVGGVDMMVVFEGRRGNFFIDSFLI